MGRRSGNPVSLSLRSLTLIHQKGGVLVYMICDGRGAGLLTKVRGLALGASKG
jgi:GTP cyclohydrolase II